MNKGAIRSHIKALLNRNDLSDTLADTFVTQAISRIERTLRLPSMEKQVQYNISGATSFITVPTDFLEIISLYHGNTSLSRVPLTELLEFSEGGETGTPKFFCREIAKLLIHPKPTSGQIKMNYYGSFPAMNADTDENALAISSPDIIIYGALSYAADHFIDERGPLYEQKYQTFYTELKEQADLSELSGTVQSIRPTYSYED